jgi:hypothetical protein
MTSMMLFKFLAVSGAFFLTFPPVLMNSYAAPQYAQSGAAFSDDELDQMLAPIARMPPPQRAAPPQVGGNERGRVESLN